MRRCRSLRHGRCGAGQSKKVTSGAGGALRVALKKVIRRTSSWFTVFFTSRGPARPIEAEVGGAVPRDGGDVVQSEKGALESSRVRVD